MTMKHVVEICNKYQWNLMALLLVFNLLIIKFQQFSDYLLLIGEPRVKQILIIPTKKSSKFCKVSKTIISSRHISHVATTEHYYDQIVDSLLKASTSLSQNKPSNVRKNPVIPNWNQNVKAAHAEARQSYLNWIKLQKPTAGLAYESMINSRKTFKYALRKTKSTNDQLFADNIAASLTSGQSSPNFWKHINLANYNKYKTPVSTCVNGQTGDQNIANMWEDHYKSLMNFPEIEAESVAKQFVHQTLSNCDLNELNLLPLCNVRLIQAQLHKLKRKCAPGLDNICTEHLIYSHPLISVHISMLFNVCLTHGFIPNRCIASVITPVVKSNKNSVKRCS